MGLFFSFREYGNKPKNPHFNKGVNHPPPQPTPSPIIIITITTSTTMPQQLSPPMPSRL